MNAKTNLQDRRLYDSWAEGGWDAIKPVTEAQLGRLMAMKAKKDKQSPKGWHNKVDPGSLAVDTMAVLRHVADNPMQLTGEVAEDLGLTSSSAAYRHTITAKGRREIKSANQ